MISKMKNKYHVGLRIAWSQSQLIFDEIISKRIPKKAKINW
jgi:hypothetical protein